MRYFPAFYHRRVHSFHECRATPLLADTPAETPAWRTSLGRCWFQGFMRLVQGTCFRAPWSLFWKTKRPDQAFGREYWSVQNPQLRCWSKWKHFLEYKIAI